MLSVRTIMHATDFSEHSRPALELATALARDYGATMVIVHVAQLPMLEAVDGMLVPTPIAEAEDFRPQLEAIRPTDARVNFRHRLAEGDAAEEIVKIAKEEKADLIVIGTHGRTGLSRLVMGSVAEAILRSSPCPVLAIKTPPKSA